MKSIINIGGEVIEVDNYFFESITVCKESEIGDTIFVTFLSGDNRDKQYFSIYKENYVSLKRELRINKILN